MRFATKQGSKWAFFMIRSISSTHTFVHVLNMQRWCPPSTGNCQLPAVQQFVLKRAPKIGMLITIHCSSLATSLVWPAEVTAWNCVSYTQLSQCAYWETELALKSQYTHAPQRPVVHTNAKFHSFHTPLHCGILPSQQKLCICPQ